MRARLKDMRGGKQKYLSSTHLVENTSIRVF